MIDYSMLKAISKISDDQKVKSIVNSLNPNQQNSKNWLITESLKYFQAFEQPRFLVAAGWYGLLANKLTEFGNALSFDKDPQCKTIGEKLYPNVKFKTYDMVDYRSVKEHDVILCTSCEHIEQDLLNEFISRRRKDDSIVILQSNNYYKLPEHINCVENEDEFESKLKLKMTHFKGSLQCDGFKRFMIIGA